MTALLSATLLALTLAIMLRDGPKTVTAAVLLLNWCINTGFVELSGSVSPWLMFAVVDYLSALAIYMVQASRWQGAIVATYVVQIVVHAAFGLSDRGPHPFYTYWWSLYYIAWAQLGIFYSWAAYDRWRDSVPAGRVSPDHAPHAGEAKSR